MSSLGTQILAAIISGGLIGGVITYLQVNRFRRKQMIAEALETALARVEVLYKIRRRTKDKKLLPEDELAIRNEMHSVQQKTDYYIGILNTESAWLGDSYDQLVKYIKAETEELFRKAWKEKPKGVGAELKDAEHPKIGKAKEKFINDTRRFFNPIKRLYFGTAFRIKRWTDRNE